MLRLKLSLSLFILLAISYNAMAAKVDRTREAFMKYPKINIKMDIKVKKDYDSKSRSLYSVGGDKLGYAKDKSQDIVLEIQLRNLGMKTVGPFVLQYEVLGQKRSTSKVKEDFVAGSKSIEIDSIKRGETKTILSEHIVFSHDMKYGRFSNFQGVRRRGERYSGYEVTLYYDNTPILIGTN
jgi:hypothetical protein